MNHSTLPRLAIIIGSTRPTRLAPAVASWIESVAHEQAGFEVSVVDLQKVDLPFLDEDLHPASRTYAHQHSRDWSELIDGMDAFVIVSPEYNHAFSAPLKNALDYLYFEWHHKPVGVVSYGGVSAGTRSAQLLNLVFDSLRLIPVADNVHIPFIAERVKDGVLEPNELMAEGARRMLHELKRMEMALAPLRHQTAASA